MQHYVSWTELLLIGLITFSYQRPKDNKYCIHRILYVQTFDKIASIIQDMDFSFIFSTMSSRSVSVSGIPTGISEFFLQLYFEDESGGLEVTHVNMTGPGTADIVFFDMEGMHAIQYDDLNSLTAPDISIILFGT